LEAIMNADGREVVGKFGTKMVAGLLVMLAVVGWAAWAGAAEMGDPPLDNSRAVPADKERQRTVMILGLSWHPGFCEGRPKAAECRDQAADAPSARQFSLHGLWRVRKSYCGVPEALKDQDKKRSWLDMPELALGDTLKVELARAMPGMASGLERHEWIKHGTCSGDVAADYYARSLALLAEVNASEVQALFARKLGERLGEAEIKSAFETAFGPGSGDKVRLRCRKDGDRRVITGLTIGLGEAETDTDLTALIAAAGRTKFGCTEGIVDRTGLQ
jgi:ribonuclease T2